MLLLFFSSDFDGAMWSLLLLKKKYLAGFCLVREVPSEKNGDGKEKEHDGRVAARPNLEVLNNYKVSSVMAVEASLTF